MPPRSARQVRRRSSNGSSGSAPRSRPRNPTSCPDGDGRIGSTRDGEAEEPAMWEQVQQALNQSSDRVIAGLANLLPGLVALIVALVVSSVAAWLFAVLLRRFLRGIH